MIKFSKKRILIVCTFVFLIGGIFCLIGIYLLSPGSPESPPETPKKEVAIEQKGQILKEGTEFETAEEILESWLKDSLKPEFLPQKIDEKLEIQKVGITQDEYAYVVAWNIEDKEFAGIFDFNVAEKPQINYYFLKIFHHQKINLNEKLALETLNQYLILSKDLKLKCAHIEKEDFKKDVCLGGLKDEENNKKDFIVGCREEKENGVISRVGYYLRPPGGSLYEYGFEGLWGLQFPQE